MTDSQQLLEGNVFETAGDGCAHGVRVVETTATHTEPSCSRYAPEFERPSTSVIGTRINLGEPPIFLEDRTDAERGSVLRAIDLDAAEGGLGAQLQVILRAIPILAVVGVAALLESLLVERR